MQAIHHASPIISLRKLAPGSWLAASGLNEGELALAKIHRRSAERLVEVFFKLQTLPARIRAGVKSLLRSPINREYEQYLAGSADRFDLERRMQQWERRPKSLF